MDKTETNICFLIGVAIGILFSMRVFHASPHAALISGGIMVVGLVLYRLAELADFENCPRVILGYNCRGKTCDHSPQEVARAKAVMRRP